MGGLCGGVITVAFMPESVGRRACDDVLTGCVVGCPFCRGGAEALACMTCVGDANAAGSGVATTRVGERTEYVGMAVGLKVLDGPPIGEIIAFAVAPEPE